MKKIIIMTLFVLTGNYLFGESTVKTITFDDIDFGGAFSSVEKVREFKEKVREYNVPEEKMEDIPYREKIMKSYVRKYLGENNLLSFILLNDIRNDRKFKEYDIEYTGNDMRNDYFVNNSGIIKGIFKFEIDKRNINIIGRKIEEEEAFTDLQIFKTDSDKIDGIFLFDFFAYETKCKCSFRATKGPEGKWIVQELRIPKKGSDKFEDGLLVYSRERDKVQ